MCEALNILSGEDQNAPTFSKSGCYMKMSIREISGISCDSIRSNKQSMITSSVT